MLLQISENSTTLHDQEKLLDLCLKAKAWEEELAFQDYNNSRAIFNVMIEEKQRLEEARKVLSGCVSPLEERAAKQKQQEEKKGKDLKTELVHLQKQKVMLTNAQTLNEQRKNELAMLKDEYSTKRKAVDSVKRKAKESTLAMAQQSKRAKTDLIALQLECTELKQIEKDMDEWYSLNDFLSLSLLLYFVY